ncbi:MAG: TetR/AcrR family transcriptional regulator [bacterium]
MGSKPRGRPPKLNAEQIIDAALRIGLQNLTMTRLASELGTGMASLYHHVSGIDAVTAAVADRLIEDVDVMVSERDDGSLQTFLFAAGNGLRNMFLCAPGFAAIANRSPRLTGKILAVHEKGVSRLVDMGVDAGSAFLMIRVIADYVEASTAREDCWGAAGETTETIRANHQEAIDRGFPALIAAHAELDYDYLNKQFELGLRAMVTGLSEMAKNTQRGRATPPPIGV